MLRPILHSALPAPYPCWGRIANIYTGNLDRDSGFHKGLFIPGDNLFRNDVGNQENCNQQSQQQPPSLLAQHHKGKKHRPCRHPGPPGFGIQKRGNNKQGKSPQKQFPSCGCCSQEKSHSDRQQEDQIDTIGIGRATPWLKWSWNPRRSADSEDTVERYNSSGDQKSRGKPLHLGHIDEVVYHYKIDHEVLNILSDIERPGGRSHSTRDHPHQGRENTSKNIKDNRSVKWSLNKNPQFLMDGCFC